jgi:hypothetical protein
MISIEVTPIAIGERDETQPLEGGERKTFIL